MPAYEFTLILSGIDEATEEAGEALYSRIDDGKFASSGGVASIEFAREAGSLLEAIRSAIGDVRNAGFETARVEIEADVIEGAVVPRPSGDQASRRATRAYYPRYCEVRVVSPKAPEAHARWLRRVVASCPQQH